jgi:hypothetical protein
MVCEFTGAIKIPKLRKDPDCLKNICIPEKIVRGIVFNKIPVKSPVKIGRMIIAIIY